MIRLTWAAMLLIPGTAAAQGANQNGERAFQRCYSCHSVVPGEKGLSGPNLSRLANRPVASDPDFDYSPAFREFAKRNKRWTSELLERFLTDPEALVPGNQMGFFGLNDTKQRAAITGYLLEDR